MQPLAGVSILDGFTPSMITPAQQLHNINEILTPPSIIHIRIFLKEDYSLAGKLHNMLHLLRTSVIRGQNIPIGITIIPIGIISSLHTHTNITSDICVNVQKKTNITSDMTHYICYICSEIFQSYKYNAVIYSNPTQPNHITSDIFKNI